MDNLPMTGMNSSQAGMRLKSKDKLLDECRSIINFRSNEELRPLIMQLLDELPHTELLDWHRTICGDK